MKILYVGDIMAESGIKTVEAILPNLRKDRKIDIVIAQAENVSDGKGMTVSDMQRLQKAGVDFFTGGNHTPSREELHDLLTDQSQPVIGPANMHGCPGRGWKYLETPSGKILVISLLGQTFGNRKYEIDNPLIAIDRILMANNDVERSATIVNFHGDFSSEKRIIGYYLDGQVTAVIGDHWHVPTADATVLPKGTAHITDVGMCGSLHSSLGVELSSVIPRWKDNVKNTNVMATEKPWQFNAVLIEVGMNGLAKSIEPIQQLVN